MKSLMIERAEVSSPLPQLRGALAVFALLTALNLCGVAWAEQPRWTGHAVVPWAGRDEVRPHAWIRERINPSAKPDTSTAPGGLWPSDIAQAYGISAGGGAGATVAIVDAYDSPNAEADLGTFSTQFKLPACTTANGCFKKVNQTGGSSPPRRNSGWEVEINLDTQWVHAVAPNAKILLVEADSSSTSDLMTAVNYAKLHASVVSMSWGGGESRSQTSYDSRFVAQNVTFLASSGDTGGVVEWPASSTNVIGVGGTQLAVNSSGRVASPVVETAWSGSGGGCSTVESMLGVQGGFVPSSCRYRATPDVSITGGDVSAVATYVSRQGGWYEVYGTSLSVQLWAGLLAIVNGTRAGAGKQPLSLTEINLYSGAAGIPSLTPYITDYRDITSGAAGKFKAGPGWDFITGLGSPLAGSMVSYLVGQP